MGLYFSGRVHTVLWNNDDFYVLKVVLDPKDDDALDMFGQVPGGPIGVKGLVPGMNLDIGSWFGFEAKWETHPKFGRQLSITKAPIIKGGWTPETATAMLQSHAQIGERVLARLNKHFGDDLVKALNRGDQDEFTAVPGITPFTAVLIIKKWASLRALFQTLEFLAEAKVPKHKISEVWAHFGEEAKDILTKNPWALVRIDGIRFEQADEVALRLDLDKKSPLRIQGAALYAVKNRRGMGHMYLSSGDMVSEVQSLVQAVTDSDVAQALAVLHKEGSLVIDRSTRPGTTAIYEPWMLHLERECAARLHDRINTAVPETEPETVPLEEGADKLDAALEAAAFKSYAESLSQVGHRSLKAYQEDEDDYTCIAEAALEDWSEGSHIKLSDAQRKGALNALTAPVSVLAGLPGTGKTTALQAVVAVLQDAGVPFLLCAPTGIAAKRMSSLTKAPAATIHRAFHAKGWTRGDDRESTYSGVVGDVKSAEGSDGSGEAWGFGPDNPHPARVVICDECFHWRQPVLTEDGWMPIGKIVENRIPVRVWARNPNTRCLELKRIVRWIKNPNPRNLLKIEVGRSESTRSARIIRCTPEHKILTPSGYVRAGVLRPGDRVIVRGMGLSADQRSILLGSILGDGHLSRRQGIRRSPQMVFTQGVAQEEYLLYKRRAFGDLSSDVGVGSSGYIGGKPVLRFRIPVMDELLDISQEMIPAGEWPNGRERWSPSEVFLSWVDRAALAIWFADQGHVSLRETGTGTSRYAALHTERFSESDQHRIASRIVELTGASPHVQSDGKGYFYLRFSKVDTEILLSAVANHTPACMEWKVPGACALDVHPEHTDTCTAGIRSATSFADAHYRSVYDLEVEDHHNYVAGNVVVSNCSMADQHLMFRLLICTHPKARIVLVGDPAQLPSVGPGNVLRDIINTGLFPMVNLTEIFRQEETSDIVYAAHATFRGKVPETGNSKGSDFVLIEEGDEDAVASIVSRLVEKLHAKNVEAKKVKTFQVLSPRHAGTLGVTNLNQRLRTVLNPASPGLQEHRLGSETIREDDRVMVVKNNYKLNIFNGDVGKVARIDRKAREVEIKLHGPPVVHVRIPFKEASKFLRLAYCVTIHKSQGQEFDIIVMPLVKGFGHQLQRNLFYTAITRAKKQVYLIGHCEAMERAVHNNREDVRNTLFPDRLALAFEGGSRRGGDG